MTMHVDVRAVSSSAIYDEVGYAGVAIGSNGDVRHRKARS